MYDDFVWRGELDAFNKWEQYKWHTAKCRVTFNTRGYHKKNQKKYFLISHAPETLLSGSFSNYNKARFVIFRWNARSVAQGSKQIQISRSTSQQPMSKVECYLIK